VETLVGVILNEMVVVVLQAVNQPYCASCVIWSLLHQVTSKLVFLCFHAWNECDIGEITIQFTSANSVNRGSYSFLPTFFYLVFMSIASPASMSDHDSSWNFEPARISVQGSLLEVVFFKILMATSPNHALKRSIGFSRENRLM
jgi:hypothetical protein